MPLLRDENHAPIISFGEGDIAYGVGLNSDDSLWICLGLVDPGEVGRNILPISQDDLPPFGHIRFTNVASAVAIRDAIIRGIAMMIEVESKRKEETPDEPA